MMCRGGRSIRGMVLTAMAAAFCAVAPAAQAAGTCVYDDVATVTATAESGVSSLATLTVSPSGGLTFDGAACGSATTANTTAVNVDASGRFVRIFLRSPVTTTVIRITGSTRTTDVVHQGAGGAQWAGGRLPDGRHVADLDGDGAAELITSAGELVLNGGSQNDTLSGAGGFQADGQTAGPVADGSDLLGGSGADTITGPSYIWPGPGDDTLIASAAGRTTLRYLEGNQGVRMKPDLSGTEPDGDAYGGTDSYVGFTAAGLGFDLWGTPHDDVLYGGSGDDYIEALGGNDQVRGLDGDDVLLGRAGSDSLYGGSGDDTLESVAAGSADSQANTLRGGPGSDVYWGSTADDDFGPLDDDAADTVHCFGGTDMGRADRVDTLEDCEFGPAVISFAPATASVDEGTTGQLTLSLSYALDVPAAVDVLSLDGTSKNNSDHAPVARRVTFAAGETTATVDVSALADDEDEPAETFTVALANPSNAPALGGNATVTVNDKTALGTLVNVAPEPGTGTGGTYLAPPTVAVTASGSPTEVRCVLDPATTPATFADIPSGDCPYLGAGQKVAADGAHTLCAASTSAATGESSPVACASWKTDATPPAVTCGAPGSFVVGDTGKVVTAAGADATSGAAAAAVSAPADTATSGDKTVTLIGRDVAGNATTATCPYRVSSVVLCGQPLVLHTVQIAGRRVQLAGLAAPADAGKLVTINAFGKRVGTAVVAGNGAFSLTVKAPKRAQLGRVRYQAALPGGSSSRALKLSRSLVITKRAGNVVTGKVLAKKSRRPARVVFYRQNTCTSKRVFATAKVSRKGTFKVRLAGPVAPEPVALYRVTAIVGKKTSYTVPIVVARAGR